MQKRLCGVCRQEFFPDELFSADQIRPALKETIQRQAPAWTDSSVICEPCLDRSRVLHLQEIIEEERGELTSLDERVLQSLSEHEILTRNTESAYDEKTSFGDRLSDKMATFGGSWFFLILFTFFLVAWITFNELGPKAEEFDPYPYILLNLILSCLAAVQAPIIMMSQNRQEAKDRLRSQHDYQVNLKAELEIRQLHMKIDQLLKHQWQRMLEIQQLQFELMRENRKGPNHEAIASINKNSGDTT
jgi:uncharacterized membrane protein